MGKKIRDKVKKLKPKRKNPDGSVIKKKQIIRPESRTNKIIKSGTTTDWENELAHLNEVNRANPTNKTKNKEKRRELVTLRNSMKNKIKAKLRRKHQQRKEAFNTGEEEETGGKYQPKQKSQTIDSMREKDETFIDANDNEMTEALNNDEYKTYYKGEYEPQILWTTSIKHTGAIFKFMRELKNFIPNSFFYYRHKFDLGTIVKQAIEKGFTDVIVITERLRKPYKLLLIHLPNGPSLEFKLFNIVYQNEIPDHGTTSGHNPELLFKNFSTTLGVRWSHIWNGLFPKHEEFEGREVVTFHNQRDYIFFRYHRYIFKDDFTKVALQEWGPRFVMRWLFIQKGIYDPQCGEYEWIYTDKMGVKRRKFYI